jgi:predicted RNA-binding Zn-ribbon protein involved in translation (DUF1610 family)
MLLRLFGKQNTKTQLPALFVAVTVTYEKLRAASDVIPPSVVDTWQPPQTVKGLLEFQPMADQSFKIDVGKDPPDTDLEQQEWLPLGEHHALSLKWLRKNYNKVGNMLLAPSARETKASQAAKQSAYLAKVADELEAALSSGITGFTERGGYTFNCGDCGKLVVRNADAMDAGETALCSTQGCDGEYKLVRNEAGGSAMQPLLVRFECDDCSAVTAVAKRKVAVGLEFNCSACKQRYRVVSLHQNWTFAKMVEEQRK